MFAHTFILISSNCSVLRCYPKFGTFLCTTRVNIFYMLRIYLTANDHKWSFNSNTKSSSACKEFDHNYLIW